MMTSTTAQKKCSFLELSSVKQLKQQAESPPDLRGDEQNLAKRIEQYIAKNENFSLFYGTERIDSEIINSLFSLAEETNALKQMQNMQAGEVVNKIEGFASENRPALHTALRDFFSNPQTSKISSEASAKAKKELSKIEAFLKKIDKENRFTDLIVIGIGGSELGPQAAYVALKHLSLPNRRLHFINNIDPDNAATILKQVDLNKTLVAVLSKGGNTLETLTNEKILRTELQNKGLNPKEHIITVTLEGSLLDKPSEYLECFHIWEWVGGRFSVTSAIGALPIGFACGFETFYELLKGAHSMDQNALSQDMPNNLPLIGALLDVWNHNFLKYDTLALIPYSQQLQRLPAHIQQVEMESNGKSIDKQGQFVDYLTGTIIFGEPGTCGQHSFFQMLHQGTTIVPIEFIGFKECSQGYDVKVDGTTSQQKLLANLFAQAIALAVGQKNENRNKCFQGNRPSHILLGKKVTAYSVGALLAYFENKIVFEGFILGINSFDQEGVQLGKVLANKVLEIFQDPSKENNSAAGATFLRHLASL